MQVLSPFGPKLGKIKLPKKLIKKINIEVEKIISKNLSKKNDYSNKVVGQVYQEIQLPRNFINKQIKNFIEKNLSIYLKKSLNKKTKKVIIKNFWVVRQFKNEYNPVHFHSGDISGVGYLKVPKNLGEPYQKNKPNFNGQLQLIHGSRMFMSKSTFDVKPKVGDFYFFPNYLMHQVFLFIDTDEERRSISFNALIDENIYDVYSPN